MKKKQSEKTAAGRWENFWYYYKYHVLVILLVALALAVTLRDCATRVEPDVQLKAILSTHATVDMTEAVEAKLVDAGVVPDINGDGKQDAFLQVITLPEQIKSEQDMMAQQQVMLALAEGASVIYLTDASTLDEYGDQEIFEDMSGIAQQYGLSREQIYVDEETGDAVGISLAGNTLLGECGFDTESMYLSTVARHLDHIGDKNADAAYESSLKIIEHLLGCNPK
ncbi:MAG: hypothetical protein E7409_01590 [Ruminococcaceae bacterium]|nr:hypothetical protein [Oscillospiraceae bacterium]